jgi:RND family efflux transporter MFP subunit
VRSRVSGYLSEIHFTDGQMVRKGDLLFVIDHRPFQIVLDQMRANLAQARANLAFTEADLARGQELLHNKTITEQTYDQRTQAKRVAEASVAAQEAMVHSAELDLNDYSELRAPVDGRIGDRRVSVGNLVTGGNGANTTVLATIVSVDPIRFEFTFDEASYLRYQRFAGTDTQMASGQGGVPVALKLIDETDFQHAGKMDFVDNVIDRSSGTIRGRAVFANPNGLFTPGMFGRLRVPGSPPYTALLIPDAAIGSEQARKYVLVVDDGSVARQRYVVPGQLDDGLRVIKDGLTAADRVIVSGLMRARPGVKVAAEEKTAPAASSEHKDAAQSKAD